MTTLRVNTTAKPGKQRKRVHDALEAAWAKRTARCQRTPKHERLCTCPESTLTEETDHG